MKLIVQRVTNANVKVDDEITGKNREWIKVLVGFSTNDTEKEAEYLAKKLTKLRIFIIFMFFSSNLTKTFNSNY